jgi:predicted RNA-binding protein with PUA-like domain
MAKQYWLCKSEPENYSFERLKKEGKTAWTGVRNYQARNTMRDLMKPGDGVLFYHSSTEIPAVVGLAEVGSASYPDPTQFDAKSEYYDPKATKDEPRWMLVDLKFAKDLKRPVSLEELRGVKGLEKMMLLKRGMRLSIQPVTPAEWAIITKLGGV